MSSLKSDTAALFALRMVGTAVPLIAIPVMSRALGPAGYGEVAIGLAVYSFMVTASIYGFMISANRRVAIAEGEIGAIQRTLQNVIVYQVVLAVVVLVGFLIVQLIISVPERLVVMIYAAIASILIGALFPSWAFQGLRMLKEGAMVEVASRLLMVGVLAIFVRTPEDAFLAFLTQVMWVIPAGIYALIRFGAKGFYPRRRLVTRASFTQTLAEGLAPFLTNVFANIYTALNTLVLGAVAGSAIVANYAGADKLTLAARVPVGPLQQAVFPRLSQALASGDEPAAARLSRILFWGCLATLTAAAIFCLAFAPTVLNWYLGPGYEAAGNIARILALSLPFLAISLWGELVLQAAGHAKRSTIGIGVGAFAHVVYILPFSLWLSATGVAIAVVVTEAIIAAVILNQVWRLAPRFQITQLVNVTVPL